MNTKKHRHFVAIPLTALALLLIAGVNGAFPVSADSGAAGAMSVHLVATKDQSFRIGSSLQGMLSQATELDAEKNGTHLRLSRGQALLAPVAYVSADAGAVRVHAFGAPFVLIRDGGTTVAALKKPVLLEVNGTPKILFAGQQASVRDDGSLSVATLPSDWMIGMLHAATELMNTTAIALAETYEASMHAGGEERRIALLQMMMSKLPADGSFVQDVLADEYLGQEFLSLLPSLALSAGSPLQPGLVRAWGQKIVVLGLTEPASAAAYLNEASIVPDELEVQGLPLQASEWRETIADAARHLLPTISGDDARMIADAETRVSAVGIILAPQETASAEPEAKVLATDWSNEELVLMTQGDLASAGALIATSTAFTGDALTQTVKVQGVYVAENGKDVPYSFTYDPVQKMLIGINRDGALLPNAVPLSVFFR